MSLLKVDEIQKLDGSDYSISELTQSYEFDTVTLMKASLIVFPIGKVLNTKGYYTKGDAGAARYLIVAAQAADGYGDHALANGNVAVLQVDGVLNHKQFGIASDGTADDTAAFRALWQYLRSQWYDNNLSYRVNLSGDIVINNPTEDLNGYAVYVIDFPVEINGGNLKVTGTTSHVIQSGTYETNNLVRVINKLSITSTDGLCNGFMVADSFQSRLEMNYTLASNCDTAYTFLNIQDLDLVKLRAVGGNSHYDFTVSSNNRASGSNGAFTVGTGTAISNNNIVSIDSISPVVSGLDYAEGTNNKFSGVIQGGTVTGYFVDITGGNSIKLGDLWLETSTATHRELRIDAVNCDAKFDGIHGATTGANAQLLNGTITWLNCGDWVGSITVTDANLIYDYFKGSSFTGSNSATSLSSLLPITENDEAVVNKNPVNKSKYTKGSLLAGANIDFSSFGNGATSNNSKALRAHISICDNTTSKLCAVTLYADGQSSYPAARYTVTEDLGTLTELSCAVTSHKAGSSPFHVLRGRITNNSANVVFYEVFIHESIF